MIPASRRGWFLLASFLYTKTVLWSVAMIRKIRKSDYEAVDRLLLQLHKVHVDGRPELFHDLEHFMSKDSFENLIADEETVFAILVEKWDKVVGCCFASVLNHSGMVSMKTVYIDQIVVDEKYRRKKIGLKMFKAVRKYAKKIGAKRVDLMVWSHNETAIRAYQSYGMMEQRCVYELLL